MGTDGKHQKAIYLEWNKINDSIRKPDMKNKNMKLTEIRKVPNSVEFWAGVEFRLYNVGMNVSKENDFYDYMLIYLQWDKSQLLLVNVTRDNTKAGSVMSAIQVDSELGGLAVTCEAVKKAIGEEDVYLIEYSPMLYEWYL